MSEKISRLPENTNTRPGFTTSLGSATGENLRSELRGFVCVTELLLMDLHVKPTNAEVHLAKEQRLLVAGMVSLSLFLQRILPPPPTPPPLPRDPSAAAAAESGVPSLGEIWGRAMKEKRGLEAAAAGGDGHPEAKRARPPALASVIVEALKVDSLQRLCSSLEPILRRVVSEEVERALGRLGPATITGRISYCRAIRTVATTRCTTSRTRCTDSPPTSMTKDEWTQWEEATHWKAQLLRGTVFLVFGSPPLLPSPDLARHRRCPPRLYPFWKVKERKKEVNLQRLPKMEKLVLYFWTESCAKLDIVVLEGDFNNEDEEGWSGEEFESHVVKEREGKRPLLTGDVQVTLKEGVGTVGELTFTDNSSWIRSRKFRLGLKISSGFCEGIRIREAKTEAFMVKDHRGELYKKHYPPALKDEVWRLEKIGKDGSFHKRLNKAGISTVEDFLRLVVRDPQKLRSILGSGMSNKMWDILVEHAKTCVLSGKYYIYYSDENRSIGAIFNNIYAFCGLISGEQFYSSESLDDSQKLFADALVKKAYDNWMYAIEYDGKALLNSKPKKKAAPTGHVETHPPLSQPASYEQRISSASMTGPSPAGGSGTGTDSIGYDGNQAATQPSQLQSTSANVPVPYDDTFSFLPPSMLMGSDNQETGNDGMGLELGQLQQAISQSQSIQPANVGYDDWTRSQNGQFADDFTEDIRMKSHQMLESEDMQQLLRVFSMGGASTSLQEDAFGFPTYMPSPLPNLGFEGERTRSSGKAVVGWLKIKAAMRWGIFVRKKAAERRAQLVELDD
ncbi:hypothetical protein OsJ_05602 [Oryza sativa Japonica Group]|uniref:Uncharacterized protein n=1 Tax=Oryza sativa subsp. japonica TaxID=39947 RepID=B9F3D4_ORYSJ|nr:hypothetical protein OsJ_05602 [Oryza sativa Japonica Group]